MCFVPEARVRHAHQLTLRTFWKQHFNYGTGAWQFRKSKQARGLAGPELEPLRFYLDLLSHAWKHGLDQPLRLSLLLALSQAANALGFGWAALRGDGGRNIAGRQQDNRA